MTSRDRNSSGLFDAAYSLETNEQTQEHYKSWAETYDREVAEDNRYAQPERVASLLKKLQPNHDCHILDAGCGSGLSGFAINQAGYTKIDGCDFSPEMLKKCLEKECYDHLFEGNLNCGQPDISDASYDVVTCVGVFSFGHVFPDACDDLLRILRPGGLLIIAVNQPYWEQGELAYKIDSLESQDKIRVVAREFGEHLPGHNVKGWVIALEKVTGPT